jgi:hypothetical protein
MSALPQAVANASQRRASAGAKRSRTYSCRVFMATLAVKTSG